MSELLEKVVVVTQMKKIPTACAYCKYYENMGGNRGRGSDGACTARGTLYATRGIRVSKERLDNCPKNETQKEKPPRGGGVPRRAYRDGGRFHKGLERGARVARL